MVSYYVGERIHVDRPGQPDEGIPVVDTDGQEIYVLPEEFDHLGRPEADAMHFKPEDLEEGEK